MAEPKGRCRCAPRPKPCVPDVRRFLKLPAGRPDGTSERTGVARRRRFYPIDFARGAFPGRRRRVRPRWRTLTSISGTTGNPRGPADGAAARTAVRSSIPPRAHYLPFPPARNDDGNHRVMESRRRLPRPEQLGVSRHRSYTARSPFQNDSQRNIWPGRPDVSYWRNMARGREIFPLEALASGDVYLNNYFLTPSYGAYATPGYPPAGIFHPPRS